MEKRALRKSRLNGGNYMRENRGVGKQGKETETRYIQKYQEERAKKQSRQTLFCGKYFFRFSLLLIN